MCPILPEPLSDEQIAARHAGRGVVPDPVDLLAQVHQAHGKGARRNALAADAHHENALGGDDRLHKGRELLDVLRLEYAAVLVEDDVVQFGVTLLDVHC